MSISLVARLGKIRLSMSKAFLNIQLEHYVDCFHKPLGHKKCLEIQLQPRVADIACIP